jgi:hypothetical protein
MTYSLDLLHPHAEGGESEGQDEAKKPQLSAGHLVIS